jgi:hypothetical protein
MNMPSLLLVQIGRENFTGVPEVDMFSDNQFDLQIYLLQENQLK